jgi:perosamine synthetase
MWLSMKIKLFSPFIDSDEKKAVNSVFKSGFWASGVGTGFVDKFEKKFSDFIGSKKCVAVNSGTAALHLALHLHDLKGKEVILPSLSFVSTAHSILYNGGIPIFADVNPTTLCLDAESISEKISKNTKLILPVHFGGHPCNMDEINKISKQNNLQVVEDAAHAAGTTFKGKKIGSHSDFSCFSFHPVKNLAMPSGGIISLNGNQISKSIKLLKSLRWCGISNRRGVKYDVNNLGWNFYMNEFSASIGIQQLKKLNKMNSIRKEIAKRYFQELNVENKMQFNKDSSYHLYWIVVKNRNKFMKNMSKQGIETGIHYLPIHKMKLYNNISIKLPYTEKITNGIVTLPMHPNLTHNDVDYIIKYTNKFS